MATEAGSVGIVPTEKESNETVTVDETSQSVPNETETIENVSNDTEAEYVDVLSVMNDEFKRSKYDQIMSFLDDQEELNRRFQEYALNTDSDNESGSLALSEGDASLNIKRIHEVRKERYGNSVIDLTFDHGSENSSDYSQRRSKTSLSFSRPSSSEADDRSSSGIPVRLSSANARRRRYRSKTEEPKPEKEKSSERKVLTKKNIRPKSAMGVRRMPSGIPSKMEAVHERSAAYSKMSSRSSPEGCEHPDGTKGKPPSPTDWRLLTSMRKLTWQTSEESRETSTGPHLSNTGGYMPFGSNSKKSKNLVPYDTSMLDGIKTISSIHSSSGDSVEYSENYASETTEVFPFQTPQDGVVRTSSAEPSGLHNVIKYTPQKGTRKGHLRRYFSLNANDESSAISVCKVGHLAGGAAVPDINALRGRGRPIKVLKLPPLEHSPVLNNNLTRPNNAPFTEYMVG